MGEGDQEVGLTGTLLQEKLHDDPNNDPKDEPTDGWDPRPVEEDEWEEPDWLPKPGDKK